MNGYRHAMTMMTRLLTLLTLATAMTFGAQPGLAQSGGSFAPVVTVNGLGITDY
jgi:peptidyl-prolyl cis-trans isomerase SurA